jgi:serine protease Do
VALIKVDTPAAVKPTPLAPEPSGDGGIKPGDPITVLGYPGVSPKVFFAGKSRDMLDPGGMTIVDIPVPTVTPRGYRQGDTRHGDLDRWCKTITTVSQTPIS